MARGQAERHQLPGDDPALLEAALIAGTRAAITTGATLVAACLVAPPFACAAGGHFDVDDATMLAPGRCQYEAWATRVPRADVGIAHLGPACRVGPVELGLNIDRTSNRAERATYAGPALKWVTDPSVQPLAIGVALAATFDLRRGGRPQQTLYVPLTWTVSDTVQAHLNAGADWHPGAGRTRRLGLGGEWAFHDTLSVLAERITFNGEWVSRLGLRWSPTAEISIDLSAARVGPGRLRAYTLGLNHEFAR